MTSLYGYTGSNLIMYFACARGSAIDKSTGCRVHPESRSLVRVPPGLTKFSIPDLSGKSKMQACPPKGHCKSLTKHAFKLHPRSYVEVECVVYPKQGLIKAVLYHLSFAANGMPTSRKAKVYF